MALAATAAMVMGGCTCNRPSSLEQQYCETYSSSVLGPSVAIGAGFFVLAIVVWWLFRRTYRPGSVAERSRPKGPTRATAARAFPWRVAGLGTRPAAEIIEELGADGSIVAKVSERFDGKWIVEMTVASATPPVDFIGTWTTHEAACREAIDELVGRGLLRPEEPGDSNAP